MKKIIFIFLINLYIQSSAEKIERLGFYNSSRTS